MSAVSANPAAAMRAIAGERYMTMESYRRDGQAVRTPLWFAAGSQDGVPVFYVYSTADSFKIKRIRRNPMIRIAPCTLRGVATGAWIDARAEIVAGAEFAAGMRLLDRKYFPWKQLLGVGAFFRRRARAVVAIRPAVEAVT